MPSAEEIQDQLDRLTINRKNLQLYLRQQDIQGIAHVQPAVRHGIKEARINIAKIKNILRTWGVSFEEHADDDGVMHSEEENDMGGNIKRQKQPENQLNLPLLRQLITSHFNDSELRNLCFDLEIDYESLPGQGKADKARELVDYARRHEQVSMLLRECHRLLPNIDWSAISMSEILNDRMKSQFNDKNIQQPTILEVITDVDFSPPTPSEALSGVKSSWFIRLLIRNTGTIVARNCRGHLLRIEDSERKHLKRFDALDFYWSRQDRPEAFAPLDIQPYGGFQYLDIGQIKEKNSVLTMRIFVPKNHRLVAQPGTTSNPEDLPPGKYFLKIAVYADNAIMLPCWFRVEWIDEFSEGNPLACYERLENH